VSGGSHKSSDNVGSNGAYRALLAASNGTNFLKRRREVRLISFGKNSLCLFYNDATVESALKLADK
jgi:hypothetical protein